MEILTADQVAEILKVPKKTVQHWATDWEQNGTGDGPRPYRISARHTRYRADDVAAMVGATAKDLRVPVAA